jgi:bifunctional non-homologous end joining protein LigD
LIVSERILYAKHVEGNGPEMYTRACAMGPGRSAANRRTRPIASGRLESWNKCGKRDTFPIVAFVEKLGAKRRKIASLYVGRREGDRLLYADSAAATPKAVARDLRERLHPLIRKDSPLSVLVKKPKAT